MNYKIARRAGIEVPSDGFTPEEKKIAELLGDYSVHHLYAKLPTNRMKAIVALHFELGYPQDMVAQIFGVSQPTLVDQIALIQKILKGGTYNQNYARPKKKEIGMEQLFGILLQMKED